MNRTLTTLLLMVTAMAIASAQPQQQSLNMTLFDHFEPLESESHGLNSALWGYTAPDGREYALLGTYDGVHIIDITEKPIREAAYIRGPGSYWRELKVYKQYAYIV